MRDYIRIQWRYLTVRFTHRFKYVRDLHDKYRAEAAKNDIAR